MSSSGSRGSRRLSLVAVSAVGAACMVGPNYKRPAVDRAGRGSAAPPRRDHAADVVHRRRSGGRVPGRAAADADGHGARRRTTTCASPPRASCRRRRSSASRAPISFPKSTPRRRRSTQRGVVSSRGQRLPTVATVDQIGGAVSWELDFWGKYRRATEAARAQILASEWGRRAVVTSLVSQVASGYFTLRALDLQLDIAQAHADIAAGIAAADAGARAAAARRRWWTCVRPSSSCHAAHGADRRSRAADRAAGELHQRAARTKSGTDRARPVA